MSTAASEAAAAEAGPQSPLEVRWSRNSAEHRAVFLQLYRLAEWVLEARAADHEPGTWGVALDGDETVIDNSLYQKELAAKGETFTQESWNDWVDRLEAGPLPGAIPFLERVHSLGGRVAIVTNRRQHLCEATEENFHKFGIPFDVILCRVDDREKEPRWRAVQDGTAVEGLPPTEIVMWLGDNINDFPGLEQSIRFADDDAFEDFGNRFFVMPNTMYGSWEDNPE